MIYEFFRAGADGYAWATVGCISANVLFQLMVVWEMNRRKKEKEGKPKEIVVMLFFVKPGIDAMRVASDKKMEAGSRADPKDELTMIKVLELCCEAIPGLSFKCTRILKEKIKGTPPPSPSLCLSSLRLSLWPGSALTGTQVKLSESARPNFTATF